MKIEDIQCATRDSGDRDQRFRHRDRRFRKLSRNRSRSNEIAGHVGPKQLVTIKRNDWSRSPKYAAVAAGSQPLDEQLALARVALTKARERIPGWTIPLNVAEDGADWSGIGPGLRKTYQRGSRAMRQAYRAPRVESFHEWRKRAKYLRYQLRLLRAAWPRVLRANDREVKALGDLLGDDHDLAVLEQTIEQADALNPGQDVEQLLLALAAQRREQLRNAARWLGERVYAEKPKHLDRRLRRYWRAARRSSHSAAA